MDIQIRIAGEAGQGVQTTGDLLLNAFAGLGLHVAAGKSYMSRIRGGLNWVDIRIGTVPVHATRARPDLLVALNTPALEVLRKELAEGGTILFNGMEQKGVICVDLAEWAKQAGGKPVMANAVAAGATYALLGYDVAELSAHFMAMFGKRGPDVAEANAACAEAGAEAVREAVGSVKAPPPGQASKALYCGAEAIALGAATAGVKLVTAYPMTPGTAVFTHLAKWDEHYGIVVEQAEDEIAAANMACGAVYAGVPALVTTSGGGFALMAETVSNAGIMELPLFIVIAQRPGPATGLPTRTAQQDLLFALHAGHGEFPRALYAPGTVRQCYDVTRTALETAHACQTPVVLLTDQFLQDLTVNAEPLDGTLRPIDRGLCADAGESYVRYALTDTGISPRAIPGGPARVVCDSDAHTEDGHLTEDLQAHLAQQDKRMAKQAALLRRALPPARYGDDNATTVLVCWGSTWGPCREAVALRSAQGKPTAMLHFPQVWPLDADAIRGALSQAERVVCVEGNATGQFASVLRQVGAVDSAESMLRYDGLPFTAEYILERIDA